MELETMALQEAEESCEMLKMGDTPITREMFLQMSEQDTSVKEIYFYNYKILTPDISLENRKIIWWLSDRLSEVDGGFVLEIDLQDFDSYPEDFTFKIKFERADVIR